MQLIPLIIIYQIALIQWQHNNYRIDEPSVIAPLFLKKESSAIIKPSNEVTGWDIIIVQ